MRIFRVMPDGTKVPPLQVSGFFILGDPKFGGDKHQPHNEVKVRTEQEAIDLIKKGFSIRIESATTTRGSLIRRNLMIDGVRYT